ncbi:calcium-activated chloride channel regulator 1-like [Lampetra planeri]
MNVPQKRAPLVVVTAVLCAAVGLSHGSRVKLIDNGYEGLVIAINPAVPEDPQLVDAIKDMITNASSDLFRATKYRFYFRNVNILIPASWKTNPIYNRPKSESYGAADVLIVPRDDPTDNSPYTHQFGLCGEPGQYIHLTPNFLLTDHYLEAYGPRGKVFVHEWGHLRWGLYDEYNDQVPFYLDKGKIEFTRCSKDLTGGHVMVMRNDSVSTRNCNIDPKTGLPEEGCTFFPDVDQTASSSIMSIQALDNVKEFCSVNQHNKAAPTLHNRLCASKSTWQIMQQHNDFKVKIKLPVGTDTQPSFTLLQPTARVVTLVLDVSGSMNEANRLQRMRQASENFIMKILDAGTLIGIIVFNSEAKTNLAMTRITDEASRVAIKNYLPISVKGGTNVCAGVRHAFQVLRALDGDVSGDEIVLLTDGEDHGISSCVDEVQNSQCTVHTIALGPNADPALEKLTSAGGMTFSASDNLDTNSLVDAFSSAKTDNGDTSSLVLQLESTGQSLNSGETMKGEIQVDASIGNNTQFVVTWLASTVPEMHIIDPDNFDYQNNKFVIDTAFKTARLTIKGTSKPGAWTYKLKNKHSVKDNIAISITSSQSNSNLPPIEVKVVKPTDSNDKLNAMQVFAEVKQGSTPVVGATVIATIERPHEKPLELQLFDNGAGADAKKNDGIYSRFFAQFTATGRYSLKVKVVGDNKTTSLAPQRGSRSLYIPGKRKANGELQVTQLPPPVIKQDPTPVPDFIRVASAGSFQVAVPPGGMKDVFPPCRITDLQAELQTSSSVTLTWTAPGGDGDFGQAAMYKIMMSGSVDGLLNGTDFRLVEREDLAWGDLNAPGLTGNIENFTVTTTELSPGDELYFCVQAVDSSDNVAPLSNVAFITYIVAATTAAPTTVVSTTTVPTTVAPTTVAPTTAAHATSHSNTRTIIAAVGICVLVSACLLTGIVYLTKNRKGGHYRISTQDMAYQEKLGQVQALTVLSTVSNSQVVAPNSSPDSTKDACEILLFKDA